MQTREHIIRLYLVENKGEKKGSFRIPSSTHTHGFHGVWRIKIAYVSMMDEGDGRKRSEGLVKKELMYMLVCGGAEMKSMDGSV